MDNPKQRMNEFSPALALPYDIRGIYPDQVDEPFFEKIGRAFAMIIKPTTVAVGMDVRTSGPKLKAALINGLRKSGVDVVDIGLISTEMLYFAVGEYGYDAGISVTASHNPAEYNGTKFIKKGGVVLQPDGEFKEVKQLIARGDFADAKKEGLLSQRDILDAYLEKALSLVDRGLLKPLKIVVNPNFGANCLVLDALRRKVPFDMVPLNSEVDGSFPKGRPDPLRPESRQETVAMIEQEKPAFAAAWDADADRCFFYDEDGNFVEGAYMVAIMARHLLAKHPGETILHEQRIIWPADDTIQASGGKSITWRAGNVFMKDGTRTNKAYVGIEASGHYFWRDFYYCDSGLIPFLVVWQMVSEGKRLSELVQPLQKKYFLSGEINFTVKDRKAMLEAIERTVGGHYRPEYNDLDIVEGRKWRANIRPSDTEPLLRVNVEGASQAIVDKKVREITAVIVNE